MGSLLVASTFLNVVSPRDAEPKSAAAGGAASPDSTMQPPSSNSSAASTGTRQPPSAVPAAAVAESGTAAGAGESPASTGNASINHSRQFNVPSLNLSRMSHGGHAGDAHADGGPLTSTWAHAPLTSTFSKSVSLHLGTETARRGSRMAFLQSPSDVRTEADLHHLDEAILFSCSACASLTKGARLALARVATQASFEEGSVLCQAGRHMDRVFFILNGQAEARDACGTVLAYEEGDSIGSFLEPGSLDPHTPRTRQALTPLAPPRARWPCTVVATSPLECAVVTQQQWEEARRSETYWDARQVRSFLEDLPTFGTLTPQQLQQLSRLVRTINYHCDSVIFNQGQDCDDMFLLRSGFVRLLKRLPMDSPSRTKLNKMAVECSQLSNQLQVLTTPRGKLPARSSLFGDAAPRASGSGAESPSAPNSAHGPSAGAADSDVSPTDQASSLTKLPQLKQKASPLGTSSSAAASSARAAAAIVRPSVDGMGGGGGAITLDGIVRPRLSVFGAGPSASGAATPDRRESVGGMGAAAGASVLSRHAVGSPSSRHPGSTDSMFNGEDLVKQRAFSSRTPFLIERSAPVYVEMSNICSGALFGECTSGRRVQRAYSAVADTRVEVFQLVRSEIKARMGEAMMFLWAVDANKEKGASDEAVRSQLEKNMEWELYKRKLMQEVFAKKLAKRPLYRC